MKEQRIAPKQADFALGLTKSLQDGAPDSGHATLVTT
jgi:hypothetical protein